MAEKSLKRGGRQDADFLKRRAEIRAGLIELQAGYEERGDPQGWFDELYRNANGDAASVPWADLEPHAGLAEWIGKSGWLHEGKGIDIGCGLGDNAEALCAAGYEMTAFDLSPHAIAWAKKRFQPTMVDYRAADLFYLPPEWLGAFDFVHECYTLQTLQGELREKAFTAVSSLIKPGGVLLLNTRCRNEDEAVTGPPWPLARSELDKFTNAGLIERQFEQFIITDERGNIPHFRVLYSKPNDAD